MSAIDEMHEHFMTGFQRALGDAEQRERRIGAELKFPLVNEDGTAVSLEKINALWAYLAGRGWEPVKDAMTDTIVGARKPGAQNDTVASCETGFCKTEFSLAHVANLFELAESVANLRAELRPFAEQNNVRFLAYGIQPVTRPNKQLLMKKGRTSVWDKVFGANRVLPPEDGDDVNLFTVNAASHVHVGVSRDEAIRAVNVLNGFAPAQIALTADSSVWRGRVDPDYLCVAEKFWDWWMPDADRIGIPRKPFTDLKDYVAAIAGFRPVYVKREGKPVVIKDCATFLEYYQSSSVRGLDADGNEIDVVPEEADIDLHGTCYWFNARLSHYYTVENRVIDQQPPADLILPAALTLGLVSALSEAWDALGAYDWDTLRTGRETACAQALAGCIDGLDLAALADVMLGVAEGGLRGRGLGEERLLGPLRERLAARRCPAQDASASFERGGAAALVAARDLREQGG